MISPGMLPDLVGVVLHLGEAEYLYGRGTLHLRVMAVHDIQQHYNEAWVFLRGMAQWTNGTEIAERNALVKLSAVRRHADISVPPTEKP